MRHYLRQFRAYARLGWSNIVRVVLYRLSLKIGIHPVQWLTGPVAQGPFFSVVESPRLRVEPNRSWDDRIWWFGAHNQPLPDSPPDWFVNPFSDSQQPDRSANWWKIPDFSAGDIKGVWELSRMDWVVAWATTAACGDNIALERLNHWLVDWVRKNPPYKGPNWKCGQEASIRVMHLVTAAWLLEQDSMPKTGLVDLLRAHLLRIAPTISYAIGQQNNHATSEAAALFIGGTFLQGYDPRAEAWASTGRRWLEELADKLIEIDGSFSQYSVNYHRVMLDTYSLAEAWRRHLSLPEFSSQLLERLSSATNWLWAMTDVGTGDAPNIGANDGARLIQLSGTDFRDFRPSIQLASALFREIDAFGPGPWNTPLSWLGIPMGKSCNSPSSQSFDLGGYHLLRKASTTAVLRYPRFRFRPCQADGLHVDLWHDGTNLLRDAGTYSYNTEGAQWFSGTAAHNTIEFDGRDQMPRLGPFLFGSWLSAEAVDTVFDDGVDISATAGYRDINGSSHFRALTLGAGGLICRDTITGRFEEACLRWRLAPGDWQIEGSVARNGRYSIWIEFNDCPISLALRTTAESRYYLHKTELPEIWVKASQPGTFVTKINF